ncbi:hypothetical protein [Marinovum sp.]|uniref:hypothetical protein n=1 Tax=Marinovum sp. TaxID=2024839 RepID=UPI002B2701A9|nr:hypothetical protein [Marinovum sp.]
MTGQSRGIDVILEHRLTTIQAIAEANTEQLRLNQKASGMMVLDMKDDRDGVTDRTHAAAQASVQAALDDNLNTINRLEQELASLDEELASAVTKDS